MSEGGGSADPPSVRDRSDRCGAIPKRAPAGAGTNRSKAEGRRDKLAAGLPAAKLEQSLWWVDDDVGHRRVDLADEFGHEGDFDLTSVFGCDDEPVLGFTENDTGDNTEVNAVAVDWDEAFGVVGPVFILAESPAFLRPDCERDSLQRFGGFPVLDALEADEQPVVVRLGGPNGVVMRRILVGLEGRAGLIPAGMVGQRSDDDVALDAVGSSHVPDGNAGGVPPRFHARKLVRLDPRFQEDFDVTQAKEVLSTQY